MPNIVLPVSGSGQPTGPSGSSLVSQVARIVGGENEDSIRSQALDCLNRVRMELNMHDWRFLKTQIASTAFVAGDQTYSLGSAFKSPSYMRLLDSNGLPFGDIIYQDDENFAHLYPQQTNGGAPRWYTIRNTFADGLVTFYPIPDASVVANYTWAGEFYTRIPTITDDAALLTSIPEEVTTVLVIGGQAYILRERDKASPMAMPAWQDFQRIKNLMFVSDHRAMDNNQRFRMGTRRSVTWSANQIYGSFPPWP